MQQVDGSVTERPRTIDAASLPRPHSREVVLVTSDMIRRPAYEAAFADRVVSVLERILAVAVLLVLAPLLVLIAILIRLDSRGGAIFTQKRIAQIRPRKDSSKFGDEGRAFCDSATDRGDCVPTFTLYKFRTYHHKSEALVPERARFEFDPQRIDDVQLQLKDDPRITRVGRFLRRSSLDELPNFINVARGEMRLIGPRPEVREMFRYYTSEQRLKFALKPGITGLAQVNGRGKLNFRETLEYDLWYVKNRSWRVDAWILLKSFKVILTGDGSY